MKHAAPKAIAVSKAIDKVIREDRGRLLSALIARLGSFQLAEDALQEAIVSAISHWGRAGLPNSPKGWLLRVALNKGIDHIRKGQREEQKAQDFDSIRYDHAGEQDDEAIPDERLRLIFACCHPALEEKSRIALTLRTVCNLTTREIAAAFLDTESTMGQRLSRAKAKIQTKGIAFKIPEADQWNDRLDTVLSTIYLIFTTGYVLEDNSSRDLCKEAIFLLELMCKLKPEESEIEGALALMQLTEVRKRARIDGDGALVPVEEQNRDLWNHDLRKQAQDLLTTAMKRRQIGPYQIKAAIADCHMEEPIPDWPQMALLYQELWRFEPTPVVALNKAVVLAELGECPAALLAVEALEDELSSYQPWYAARADILMKIGRKHEAIIVYKQAIELAPNEASRVFLEKQMSGTAQ
ncbi:MAG: sigma-70 family RNA polymerase sigma factor [Rhizobiaceae bacterium]|nr:sigma-70 family RNA polymerase sigma factor [Rhizobiaceae bacterium]